MHSTPESGERAGYDGAKHNYDGAKHKKGSKIHVAVDTLGILLAVHVPPANKEILNEQKRTQVAELAKQVQQVQKVTQQSA